MPAVLESYEREAGFVFRQQLLKILKVYFDGFAIGIFEFHPSIIKSANAPEIEKPLQKPESLEIANVLMKCDRAEGSKISGNSYTAFRIL